VAACIECAQACTACADACFSEQNVADLTKCTRSNLDCADICDVTGRLLSRHTGYDSNITRAQLVGLRSGLQVVRTTAVRRHIEVMSVNGTRRWTTAGSAARCAAVAHMPEIGFWPRSAEPGPAKSCESRALRVSGVVRANELVGIGGEFVAAGGEQKQF
jgi:hypothetical protein